MRVLLFVLLIVAAALWGAGTGLVLPRAAHRLSVEQGEPWSSRCPAGHLIAGGYGGWLGRANCPGGEGGAEGAGPCGTYGPSTRTVATVTALVCAALAAAAGGPRPETAVWVLLAPVAVLLALVDHRVHRLPDVLTFPLAAVTAALLGVASALPSATGSWPTALLGGLTLGAAYLLLFLVNPSGMGFGDVKLALALGTALGWYGWRILLTGAFAGLLYGALYGLGMVVVRRAGRKSAIPLGPFMLGGAFTGLLLGASAGA
ncbi:MULTISPECIES: A24 family peptidase [unclassified Streptomyces]|uniref:prepilin peptidase n=1 Tax=unclassified Streptomyces TaxID=2593676 RepID=UPI00225AC896|nr:MULTISPECIES: A24 family peptidase [unclassified Streptomyces]MCX5293251.1 A24 family peptidase [Streptomyces sp. NBC_00183]